MRATRPRTAACVLLVATVLAGAGCGAGAPAGPEIDGARELHGLDPCGLVAPEQAQRLGLAPDGAGDAAPEGPRCTWRGGGAELTVTLWVDGGGLATLARNSDPTTARVRVAGFPALETFTDGGAFCQYDVGVATDQVVLAGLAGGAPDSCTALQELLPPVLSGLPPGG